MKNIILLILWLLPIAIFAQSDIDYFHTAANYYVNANKKNAKTTVQEGIRKFPNNQKLKDLAKKIDQLPDPEDDQNQQKQKNSDPENQKGEQQKQEQQRQQNQDKRQLDALQQNERKTKEKVDQKEMQQGKNVPQEKDW